MTTLRDFLIGAREADWLVEIDKPVDPYLEMAPVIAALDGRPLLFNNVAGSEFPVLSGQCSDRRYFALALDCAVDQLVFRMADAYSSPLQPQLVGQSDAACQEVVMAPPDL
ncbi:MAG: UbiD family decarboxylase, partial [Caldilineales bacterium]